MADGNVDIDSTQSGDNKNEDITSDTTVPGGNKQSEPEEPLSTEGLFSII